MKWNFNVDNWIYRIYCICENCYAKIFRDKKQDFQMVDPMSIITTQQSNIDIITWNNPIKCTVKNEKSKKIFLWIFRSFYVQKRMRFSTKFIIIERILLNNASLSFYYMSGHLYLILFAASAFTRVDDCINFFLSLNVPFLQSHIILLFLM